MRSFVKKSIQMKMAFMLVAIITVVLAFYGVYQYADIQSARTKELNDLADFTIRRLAENLTIPLWEVDDQWVEETILTEMSDRRIHAISVTGEGDLVKSLKRERENKIAPYNQMPDDDLITRHLEVIKDGEAIGAVEVFITKRYMIAALNREIVKILLTVLALNIIFLTAFSMMLRNIIILPVQRILNIANAITGGDFSRRIEIKK
jgi:methyl-accepting chemotaxis protein